MLKTLKEKLACYTTEKWYARWILFIFVANISDALCTIYWTENGIAEEANPLMAYLMEKGIAIFFVVKMAVITGALAILYHARRTSMARHLVIPVGVVYFLILVLHVTIAIRCMIN